MCVFSVNRRKNIWGDMDKFDHFTFKGESFKTVLDSIPFSDLFLKKDSSEIIMVDHIGG